MATRFSVRIFPVSPVVSIFPLHALVGAEYVYAYSVRLPDGTYSGGIVDTRYLTERAATAPARALLSKLLGWSE